MIETCYNKYAQRKILNYFHTKVHINSWLLVKGKPRNSFRQILRRKKLVYLRYGYKKRY